MIDPDENDIASMINAAEQGGQYLDELGKTDLATMTEDEWMTFIECVCTGFVDKSHALRMASLGIEGEVAAVEAAAA